MRNLSTVIAKAIVGKRQPEQYGYWRMVKHVSNRVQVVLDYIAKVVFILLMCGGLMMGCVYSGALEADTHSRVACTDVCPDTGEYSHCATYGHDCDCMKY